MIDVRRDPANEVASLPVVQIEGSASVILPEQLFARLRLKEGDTLHVIEEPDGRLWLSRFDADHIRTMEIADRMMDEYQETLTALAK